MDWYWHITGMHLTAGTWLGAVLALAEGGAPSRGRALARLAVVEVVEGRTARAVEIAAVAEALSKRAGVVIAHPMAPELAERIDALKASIPRGELAAENGRRNPGRVTGAS